MESKALMEYEIPAYPQKEQIQSQPSLLRKRVYKRWQKLYDLGISGMLVAGLSLSGCDKKPENNTTTTQGIEESPNQNPNASQTDNVSPAKLAALVAPVFEHGNGRGTVGCVAVAPPAFLSEDEALVVIKEELSKHGIELDKNNVILHEVMITPGTFENVQMMNVEKEKPQPLELDAQDSEKSINIEFVSNRDYFELGGERSMSTVQGYDIKKIATQVRNQIQNDTKKGVYGVFYDPLAFVSMSYLAREENLSSEERWNTARSKAVETSIESLRAQVQDFAQWLKEQGVI